VKLEEGLLVWREFSDQLPGTWPQYVQDTRRALDRFVEIGDASGVLSFARRFGPLLLCSHGFPASHGSGCQPTRREPVSRWLWFVRRFQAVIAIASKMRQDRYGNRDDWNALFEDRRQIDGAFPADVEQLLEALSGQRSRQARKGQQDRFGPSAPQWLYLKQVLDEWIATAGVRPSIPLTWNGRTERPDLEFSSYGIFGVLVMQLQRAVTGSHEIYFCDACQRPYTSTRQPRRDRRRFCGRPECKKLGDRLKKRDQRARDRALPANTDQSNS
jgi:hypothetical protein